MQRKKRSIGFSATVATLALAVFVTTTAASQEKVLHSFGNGKDGTLPYAGLIFDANGNLYGTTEFGGIHGFGTAFELSPKGDGGWTETVLHSFGNGTDGTYPLGGLIFDTAGNLYGTTYEGGIHDWGTVFELSPRQGGGWTETILHSFNDNGLDGAAPWASLIMDASGNLYGTTITGGIHPCSGAGCGTVFELSPREGGGWTEKLLHSFGHGSDGIAPIGSLIMDASGNLYGTTGSGGIHPCSGNGCGTVFELSPENGGGWSENVLHSFGNGLDGESPAAGLIFDAVGNLYGTTGSGGIHGAGTVFEMSPAGDGAWTENVLHSFGRTGDGGTPLAGLSLDHAGNLYGTTAEGGIHGVGAVFELAPTEGGGWTETLLHSFNQDGSDGADPFSGLVLDAAGHLYGTTVCGGIHYYGTVFEIMP